MISLNGLNGEEHDHTHRRFIQHFSLSLLYGLKTSQSSGPSHFQLCSDQYLSVIQEATTINQNEMCSPEKILSRGYAGRLLELASVFTRGFFFVCVLFRCREDL